MGKTTRKIILYTGIGIIIELLIFFTIVLVTK